MPPVQRVLVALEDDEAASRVVEHIANLAGARNDFEIHLVHALKPLPPQFMESRGSEDPSQEQQIERRQAGQQNKWTDRARAQVAPLIENAKSQLTAARVQPENIETHVLQLNDRSDLVPELLRAAREYGCHTIFVGYADYPWIKEHFHTHIAEQLISRAEHLAVCVVK